MFIFCCLLFTSDTFEAAVNKHFRNKYITTAANLEKMRNLRDKLFFYKQNRQKQLNYNQKMYCQKNKQLLDNKFFFDKSRADNKVNV
ncbi:MAG: hypothetical protein KC414_12200 [Romboutsia sp.]|nr:hypothetical protein [Romboutsia sp.]